MTAMGEDPTRTGRSDLDPHRPLAPRRGQVSTGVSARRRIMTDSEKRQRALRVLRDRVNPMGKFERERPSESRLDGWGYLQLVKDPQRYRDWERDALREMGGAEHDRSQLV